MCDVSPTHLSGTETLVSDFSAKLYTWKKVKHPLRFFTVVSVSNFLMKNMMLKSLQNGKLCNINIVTNMIKAKPSQKMQFLIPKMLVFKTYHFPLKQTSV